MCIQFAGQLVCLGEQKKCGDGGGPCQYSVCDSETAACAFEPEPDGLPCNDGDPCTSKDACVGGVCAGVPKDCTDEQLPCSVGACNEVTGTCSIGPAPNGDKCEDGDPCTIEGECKFGLCVGEDKDCSGSESQCMVGICDPTTGDCGVPFVFGTPCNDLDVCTTGDQCEDGKCVGKDICFCVDKPDGTACDDGYACTENDACVGGGCAGGNSKDCSMLDAPCFVGACIPGTGACEALPVQDGSPCDDANLCTEGDSCTSGVCAGEAKDCSSEDGKCAVGVCLAATGDCGPDPVPDGLPCDDGSVCTGSDSCQNGLCAGGSNLCGSCQGKAEGDPCDDADACTVDTSCLEISGLLACTGTLKDCSQLDDPCNLGACNAETGACVPAPKKDKTKCNDNVPCTEQDVCVAGECTGSDIDMCGESPVACEGPAPNDKASQAIPLVLASGKTTVMGWLNPAGETDWYSVDLVEGQLLTVEVRPHCDSALDTQIGLYQPGDKAPFVVADDGGQAAFSLASDVEIAASGPHLIGLTAYAESGSGTYILAVSAHFPPPCTDDEDCGCAQMSCVSSGPMAGKCVPAMEEETEPNDSPEEPSPVGLDEQRLGTFGTEGDEDWF